MRIEGDGYAMFAQVIKEIGRNSFDQFELATVKSVSPTVIRVDHMKIDLDATDLIIAEHLTERKQLFTLEDGSQTEMTAHSPLKPGDRVIVVSASNGQFYVVIDKAVMI